MDLMRAMTGSEFNALKAIAIEENPGPTLKRLSEENLTMPELLIDAINERALDTIGDIILEPGPDTGVSIIAQEYRDQVATLISTYGV
jgi:TerB-C domain